MGKWYTGPAPCPGCGRSGENTSRISKDALCSDCEAQLRIGRAITQERQLERNYYRLDDLVIAQMTWYTIPVKNISCKVIDLLRTFSSFDSRYASWMPSRDAQLAGEASGTTAHDTFVLPRITFEAAKELCQALKDACWDLETQRRNYRKELDVKLANEKNEIYNQGVAYGRNLLQQLNRGEISLQDFQAFQKKY